MPETPNAGLVAAIESNKTLAAERAAGDPVKLDRAVRVVSAALERDPPPLTAEQVEQIRALLPPATQ